MVRPVPARASLLTSSENFQYCILKMSVPRACLWLNTRDGLRIFMNYENFKKSARNSGNLEFIIGSTIPGLQECTFLVRHRFLGSRLPSKYFLETTLLSENESFCLQNRSQPGVRSTSGNELFLRHASCLFPYTLLPLIYRFPEDSLHLSGKALAFFLQGIDGL